MVTQCECSITAAESVLRNCDGLRIVYDPPAEGPTEGCFASCQDLPLTSAISDTLEVQFPDGLFTHQHAAIRQALSGIHTVVATRTSSGKSLTFALPAMDAACRDPNATSLFLYPQKALAGDQHLKLVELARSIAPLRPALDDSTFWISRYDGATLQEDRKIIRDSVRMLLTNPDMLHLGILQHHGNHWHRFFANLKYVAIDECHEYRGVFGTGVAHVLRRLRQVCRMHGSDPTFIASSATIASPQDHLERMIGVPFACVGTQSDGSRQGRRKFWMVTGDSHYFETGRKLAMRLADAGLSVLAFCPSRGSAERMLAKLRKSDGTYDPHVAVYRSGLQNRRRQEIEQGLRDKTIRLVFSTTALELGIDIGALDVVLCIGLPGSMMSLWQRAGRVARAGREGAIILVPGNSPIETYYSQRPEAFFGRDNEPITLNMANPRLAIQHYVCARDEVGGNEADLDVEVLGESADRICKLRSEGLMDRDEFYHSDPHAETSLRNSGDKNYRIVEGETELGEIGVYHLIRETPRNGIYRHGGQTYRVTDILRGKNLVRVRREATRHDTTAFIRKDIAVRRLLCSIDYPNVKTATVRLEVSEYLVSLTEKDAGGKVIQNWPGAGGMPSNKLPTEGTMVALRPALQSELRSCLGGRFDAAWQSCERVLASLFPTVSGPCDPQDYSSGVTKLSGGEPAIILYDLVYEGVDLTRVAFDHIHSLVENSLQRVTTCDCETDSGCIRCIQDPRQDQATSKTATIQCLLALREALAEPAFELVTHAESAEDRLIGKQPVPCPKCGHAAARPGKFCSECGAPLEKSA